MLYILKCKCGDIEWNFRRECSKCEKKMKDKYILNKEYDVIQYRWLSTKKNGERYYNPEKSIHELNKINTPLYVLQCSCGCVEFDEKRRCKHCNKKFHNKYLRNDYAVVREDWLSTDIKGHYFYNFDTTTGKPIIIKNGVRRFEDQFEIWED